MSTVTPSPIDLNSELVQTPSNAKVEASRRVINNMVASGQLTPEGEAWLKLNTDPWHDNKTTGFRGIPEKAPSQVVTMSVVQEFAISKPATLAAGNWKVRIATYPMASAIATKSYLRRGTVLFGSTETEQTMWPVQIDFSEDSANNFTEFANVNTQGLQIPADYQKGPFRVAGMGLEVINTTATLQQQGLATAAVMNQNTSRPFTVHMTNSNNAGDLPAVATCYAVKTVPQNLSEMLLLPGTTQWEAKEGAYSVVQLVDLDQTPTTVPQFPVFTSNELDNSSNTSEVWTTPTSKQATGGYSNIYQSPEHWSAQIPMNSSVQMYTGLSDQTTLTVRVRWLIVRYPNDNEKEILVLAYNSAPWDPVALEIQSRLMNKLPPAVMFKLNPKGEWWKSMIAGIADIASSGLMMMPHPLAKGAGAAIAAGRAVMLPDQKVKFKTTKTKTGGTPAQRAAKHVKGPAPKSQGKKKPRKKKVSAAVV